MSPRRSDDEDGPTFRDLFELQQNTDAKMEKITSRMTRVELAVAIMAAAVVSPKFGGPDPTQLVSVIAHWSQWA